MILSTLPPIRLIVNMKIGYTHSFYSEIFNIRGKYLKGFYIWD